MFLQECYQVSSFNAGKSKLWKYKRCELRIFSSEYSPKDYSPRIFEKFLKNEDLNLPEQFTALENVPGCHVYPSNS
jgi:hypothetical protein